MKKIETKQEVLDIVNDKDEIIGSAPYDKIHREKLTHRVAVGLVINDGGEALIQLRSSTKSAYPSHWSFSMGGHVSHGEEYVQAIVREGKEEVEVDFAAKDFTVKGKGTFIEATGAKVFYTLFEIQYDGSILEIKNEEVAAVQFVSFPTLKKMIEENKEKIHPPMTYALKKYYKKELESLS